MKEIIFATSNKHKVQELQNIFTSIKVLISSLNDDIKYPVPIENGASFTENADIKALHYSKKTSSYILADDSGLCVDVLQGEPGIYSARFAGDNATDLDNNLKLLKMMKGASKRDAYFISAFSLALEGEIIARTIGKVKGVILKEISGKEGFGYDPLFFYPPLNSSFAEMTNIQKNSVSHRYHASVKMTDFLSNHGIIH